MINVASINPIVKPFLELQCQEVQKISNKSQIGIVNYFIRLSNQYEIMYPSIAEIAKGSGCSKSTVHNHLPVLYKMGLLKKDYRHRHSSVYQLNSLLFTYCNMFKDTFKALKRIIHLTIKYPKYSAIQRCLKRAFRVDFFTSILGTIWRPLRKTTSCLKKNISLLTREREIVLSNQERRDFGLKIRFKRTHKWGSNMKQVEIPPMLEKVTKKLNLNKWGQIKLIQFPDKALEYALQKYTPKTSFNTFFMKALDWCKDNNTEPDWAYHYELSEKYKMPKDAQFISKTPATGILFKVESVACKTFESKKTFQETSVWEQRMREKYPADQAERIIHSVKKYPKHPVLGKKDE